MKYFPHPGKVPASRAVRRPRLRAPGRTGRERRELLGFVLWCLGVVVLTVLAVLAIG